MIVTIITLVIVGIYFITYFAGFLDYLFGSYFSDLRTSEEIANEDLKKALPDITDFFFTINSFTCIEVIVLQIINIDFSQAVTAIATYTISMILFFASVISKKSYYKKEILSVIIGIVLVVAFSI